MGPTNQVREDKCKLTDIEGIAKEWDSYASLRDRLRGEDGDNGKKIPGKILAESPCCADISTCCKHKEFLEPILTRMAQNSHRCVPGIDQLKIELQELMKLNKRVDTEWDELDKAAWCIRKLCGFVKMKCRRREVSAATRLQFNLYTFKPNVLGIEKTLLFIHPHILPYLISP